MVVKNKVTAKKAPAKKASNKVAKSLSKKIVSTRQEKLTLMRWAEDGYFPIDLNANVKCVTELIREVKKLRANVAKLEAEKQKSKHDLSLKYKPKNNIVTASKKCQYDDFSCRVYGFCGTKKCDIRREKLKNQK